MRPVSKRRGRAKRQAELEFFARCASGFERVLADELRELGAHRVRPLKGGVAFFGALEQGYRACLWSRVATRIQLVLGRVTATDADALYEALSAMAWEQQIAAGATLAVDAHGTNAQLRNTKFTALKVKDAVCDRMRTACGARPSIDAHDPDFSLNVALHEQKATIYLNLSGVSLHRRGYRQEGVQTEAPLKETLAAGILLLAGWPALAAQGGVLVDPMCGSGTFAIEGAWMAAGVAPGLLRTKWGFEAWTGHDAALWERLRHEAEVRAETRACSATILAGDVDRRALEIARANAERAGVGGLISFARADAARVGERLRGLQQLPGLMVANPPYGQRLLSATELPQVRAALAQATESLPAGWQVALVTPDTGIDTALGQAPHLTLPCYNGPLRAWVRLYEAGSAQQQASQVVSLAGVTRTVGLANPNSAQFAARLRKVGKERLRWARRAGVSCFRVYDADLPEYAVTVDLYLTPGEGTTGERWARVCERHRPGSVDALVAGRRFADAVALTAAVFDVEPDHVVARAADDDNAHASAPCPVRTIEEGLTYSVDLCDPYDVLLPLSLREVRRRAGELARNERVACLFATNGATVARVVAAGAQSMTLVDGFPDRLDAVKETLVANGLSARSCRWVCSDVRGWLAEEQRAHHSYDLLLCAPPVWLPAGRHKTEEWDRVRDLVELVRQASRVLAPQGKLLLAYEGDPSVKPDSWRALGFEVSDLGSATLPHDFERSARLHHAILLTRR